MRIDSWGRRRGQTPFILIPSSLLLTAHPSSFRGEGLNSLVRCFHLQSRLFLYFHLLQLFSLSFFYSFTGMAFLRSTSLLRATIECSIAEATHHGTLIPHQFGSLFLRMQNDASRVSLEFCTEERQQSIASRHLQVVFHYLDEGRHTSFRQKVKRLHSCDH